MKNLKTFREVNVTRVDVLEKADTGRIILCSPFHLQIIKISHIKHNI